MTWNFISSNVLNRRSIVIQSVIAVLIRYDRELSEKRRKKWKEKKERFNRIFGYINGDRILGREARTGGRRLL